MYAVSGGHIDIVKILLSQPNIEIDTKNIQKTIF